MIIQKFSLLEHDGEMIPLPKNSKILTVDIDNDQPFIWILVDNNNPIMETRTFKIFKTNEVFTHYFKQYIFSFCLHDKEELHVFEV